MQNIPTLVYSKQLGNVNTQSWLYAGLCEHFQLVFLLIKNPGDVEVHDKTKEKKNVMQ